LAVHLMFSMHMYKVIAVSTTAGQIKVLSAIYTFTCPLLCRASAFLVGLCVSDSQ